MLGWSSLSEVIGPIHYILDLSVSGRRHVVAKIETHILDTLLLCYSIVRGYKICGPLSFG
jgi:hypothetical protein